MSKAEKRLINSNPNIKQLTHEEERTLLFTGVQKELLLISGERNFIKDKCLKLVSELNKIQTYTYKYYLYVNDDKKLRKNIYYKRIDRKIKKSIDTLNTITTENIPDDLYKLSNIFTERYKERFHSIYKLISDIKNKKLTYEDKITKHLTWKTLSGKKYSFQYVLGDEKKYDGYYFRFTYLVKLSECLLFDSIYMLKVINELSESALSSLLINFVTHENIIVESDLNEDYLEDFVDFIYDMFKHNMPVYFDKVTKKVENIMNKQEKIAKFIFKKRPVNEDGK
ncbi:MAG: hypothetical protein HRS57_00800 [Mycoplasmataceae bacterium]|nr:hypothetical protein [Mycoplasmataceae bacterium]